MSVEWADGADPDALYPDGPQNYLRLKFKGADVPESYSTDFVCEKVGDESIEDGYVWQGWQPKKGNKTIGNRIFVKVRKADLEKDEEKQSREESFDEG